MSNFKALNAISKYKLERIKPVGDEWLRRGDHPIEKYNEMVENWMNDSFNIEDPVTEYFYDLCHDVWHKPDSENVCPSCGVNFNAEPIPLKNRHMYGMEKWFSRKIGIYDMHQDRTVEYMCPDCSHRWKR